MRRKKKQFESSLKVLQDQLESEQYDLEWAGKCIKKHTDDWVIAQKNIIELEKAIEELERNV